MPSHRPVTDGRTTTTIPDDPRRGAEPGATLSAAPTAGTATLVGSATVVKTVVLVDASPVVAALFARCIRPLADLRLVAWMENGADAFEFLRQTRPDVAVLGAELPELAGPEIAQTLAGWDPLGPTRCVLWATQAPPAPTALFGFVPKSATIETLMAEVRRAAGAPAARADDR